MAGAYSSAYSSAYDVGTGAQNLDGALFQKAPTFFQGVVAGGVQALTGTLFTKAPSFKIGTLGSGAVLTGVLFQKAPTFNVGTLSGGTSALQGQLFQKAPTFFIGVVVGGAQALAGSAFQINPSFFGGLIFAAGAGGTAQSSTDEGLRFEVWTLPQLGSFTRKYDLTRYVSSYSISDKFTEIADGRLQIAADSNGELLPLAKIDQLINVDRANHANDEGSVIRVLRGTTPVMHYVTKQYDDTWSSDDPTATLSLEGMELLLDRAIVPRKDYPAVPSNEPDWTYGAQSILTNTDFDHGGTTSEVVTLEINATAGTFKIGIDYPVGTGFVYTANIAWNPQAQDVADAIETLMPGWDVFVNGGGTSENPFIIEVLAPTGVDIGWATDSALLTGLATIGTETPGGNLATEPWTRSTQLITGLFHGSYTTFEISTEQFHSAPNSLKVDGDPPASPGAFPGAQQLISVTPGRTYRASVWVYPTSQAAFRFVIRTRDETYIASESTVLLANQWQQMSIPSVTIPGHVSQIVFRIATISNSDEPAWYVDDALFAPGEAAATYGAIMNDVTDPIIANGVLTWLTRTWSDTHDSAGVAWDRDLEWSVKRGQTILQLMEYARRWNYEWRIRWDTDHFEWDLFNPTTGGTNYTGTGLAITGRSGVTSSGVIARRFPEASYYQAEGEGGQWGENEDATMSTAWGRLEQYSANVQGLDAEGLTELADRLVDDSINRVDGLSVRLQVPTALPWSKFQPGDVLQVNLSPQRTGEHLRCVAVVASQGPNDSVPAYDVHFGSMVYQGEASVLQAVRVLWREFKALQTSPAVRDAIVNPPPEPAPVPGGGVIEDASIVIAASDSSLSDRTRADILCDGVADDVEIQAAIDTVKATGGDIALLSGTYRFHTPVEVDDLDGDVVLRGVGSARCLITSNITWGDQGRRLFVVTSTLFELRYNIKPSVTFSNLTFDGDDLGGSRAIDASTASQRPHIYITQCLFTRFIKGVIWGSDGDFSNFWITDNSFIDIQLAPGLEAPQAAGLQFNRNSPNYHLIIARNIFQDCTSDGDSTWIDVSGGIINGVVTENVFNDCDATPIFTGSNIVAFHNVINGTHDPGDH